VRATTDEDSRPRTGRRQNERADLEVSFPLFSRLCRRRTSRRTREFTTIWICRRMRIISGWERRTTSCLRTTPSLWRTVSFSFLSLPFLHSLVHLRRPLFASLFCRGIGTRPYTCQVEDHRQHQPRRGVEQQQRSSREEDFAGRRVDKPFDEEDSCSK